MNQVSSGPVSGLLKPRYKIISTILGELYNPTKGVDVFIDFNTFIKSLSTYQKYLNYLPFSGPEVEVDLMSSMLTTLNHWKNFSKKWDNVRIIGIMNPFIFKTVVERKYMKSYLIPHEHKFQDNRYDQFRYYVTEAVKKVQTILKYVPNMYLLTPTDFDSLVIPNILDNYEKSGRARIIISGNPLMTGYRNQPNTTMIYTKFRGKNGMQQLNDPLMIVQSFTKVDEEIMSTFCENKVFYNLLNTIIGDFDRGIVGLTQLGITSFAYDLTRGVEKHVIRADTKTVESTLPVIDKVYHDYILKSYQFVDIDSHTNMIPESSIQNLKSTMIDLVDIDGLRSLSIDGLNLLELL